MNLRHEGVQSTPGGVTPLTRGSIWRREASDLRSGASGGTLETFRRSVRSEGHGSTHSTRRARPVGSTPRHLPAALRGLQRPRERAAVGDGSEEDPRSRGGGRPRRLRRLHNRPRRFGPPESPPGHGGDLLSRRLDDEDVRRDRGASPRARGAPRPRPARLRLRRGARPEGRAAHDEPAPDAYRGPLRRRADDGPRRRRRARPRGALVDRRERFPPAGAVPLRIRIPATGSSGT